MKHFLIASAVLAALAPPAHAQRERITWNHVGGSESIRFYDSGSNFTSYANYNYGTAWRLVGIAGNRILWQEQVNAQNATLWRISDTGAYEGHAVLSPPASGYEARSVALALPSANGCFHRHDDQAYWVLWESDTPNGLIYVQLVYGDGVNVEPVRQIAKPVQLGSSPAIALTPIHGGDLAVLFAQDPQRSSVWTISRANMMFADEYLLLANPLHRTTRRIMGPASLNAHYDGTDGALLQVLFNSVTHGPFGGGAMIVNVRDTTPIGRPVRREIWTHRSSSGNDLYLYDQHEATAHTIQPPVCP